jgi:peptidoglycan/LPS O-acetylase OafA/YrhL
MAPAETTSSGPPRLHGIIALRAVFVVLAVCHHLCIHSARYCGHDWLGGGGSPSTLRVDLSFVLGGFPL